jgi:maleate isomerase
MPPPPRRIGVLAPPGNVALEQELPPFLPAGLRTHHNRLSSPAGTLSRDGLVAMLGSADQAAQDLAQVAPEIILFGCTSGSLVDGPGQEAARAERITEQTGIPAVTTSTAILEGLRAVGARRLFVVTPYPDALNAEITAWLTQHGYGVVALDSFRCADAAAIRALAPEAVEALILANPAAIADCDIILICCTALHSLERIAAIEAAAGRAVIASNQASLWAVLVRMGVPTAAIDCGRLFRSTPLTTALPAAAE